MPSGVAAMIAQLDAAKLEAAAAEKEKIEREKQEREAHEVAIRERIAIEHEAALAAAAAKAEEEKAKWKVDEAAAGEEVALMKKQFRERAQAKEKWVTACQEPYFCARQHRQHLNPTATSPRRTRFQHRVAKE